MSQPATVKPTPSSSAIAKDKTRPVLAPRQLTPDQISKIAGHLKKTGMNKNIADLKGFLLDKAGISATDPDLEQISKLAGIIKKESVDTTTRATRMKNNGNKNIKEFIETIVKESMYNSPYDLSEFGKQPILTDHTSLEDLYKTARKSLYSALKNPDPRVAFDAIKKVVVDAARYGFVTGYDTAHQEHEDEYAKIHSSVVENKQHAINEEIDKKEQTVYVVLNNKTGQYIADFGMAGAKSIRYTDGKNIAHAYMFSSPRHIRESLFGEIPKGLMSYSSEDEKSFFDHGRNHSILRVKLSVVGYGPTRKEMYA